MKVKGYFIFKKIPCPPILHAFSRCEGCETWDNYFVAFFNRFPIKLMQELVYLPPEDSAHKCVSRIWRTAGTKCGWSAFVLDSSAGQVTWQTRTTPQKAIFMKSRRSWQRRRKNRTLAEQASCGQNPGFSAKIPPWHQSSCMVLDYR